MITGGDTVKMLTARVMESDAGKKLKFFVRGEMGVSYSQFSSLKFKDAILVNGISRHANHVLAAGDLVEVRLEEETEYPVPKEYAPVDVVYEDDDILIADKPAPLSTVYSPRKEPVSLENRLAARYGAGFVFRPVSRLDKGTSGLLAAAKDAHAYQLLQKQLHTDGYVREYLAVADGIVEEGATLDFPIARENMESVRRVVRSDGVRAVTHMEPLMTAGGKTLLRLRLETGRTHQIRVHLSHIGHPVAGDFLYGEEDRENLPGRFALHSWYLRLTHPLTCEVIERASVPTLLLGRFGFSLKRLKECDILLPWIRE